MAKYSPRTANMGEKICSLRRDNASYGDFWIVIAEESVAIGHQEKGKDAIGIVAMDKSTFNKMIAFYNRPTIAPQKKWRLP